MELAELCIASDGAVVTATIAGEVDMSNAADLRLAILPHVADGALGLVLDLSDVAYLDSAGIRLVFGLRERLARRGQELRLAMAPDARAREALGLAGVPPAVAVEVTAGAARRAIAGSRRR